MNYTIELRKYRKHLMELKYLRSELQYQKEVLDVLHQEFEKYYRNFCQKENVDLEQLEQKHKTRVDKFLPQPNFPDSKYDENGTIILREKPVTQKEQKKFTDLFKQIAKVAHPDKVGGNGLDFATASSAYETGDWSKLLEIAEIYNVMPKNLKQLYPLMTEEAKRLRKKIRQNQSTYSWRLHECKTKREKNKVIKQFLKQLFNLEL